MQSCVELFSSIFRFFFLAALPHMALLSIQATSPERRFTQKEIIAGEERPKYLLIKHQDTPTTTGSTNATSTAPGLFGFDIIVFSLSRWRTIVPRMFSLYGQIFVLSVIGCDLVDERLERINNNLFTVAKLRTKRQFDRTNKNYWKTLVRFNLSERFDWQTVKHKHTNR